MGVLLSIRSLVFRIGRSSFLSHPKKLVSPLSKRVIDTSILHHAFISIFIALWAVITHYISIPSSISLPASLFTRSIMYHPVTNSLVTLLARLIVMCITRGPRDTSPTIGVTNPNLDLCQLNKYHRRHL